MNVKRLWVLVPVTLLAGLAACTAASPRPVPLVGTPLPESSATSATPTTATAASTAAVEPVKAACPASVAALERAAGVSDGYRIDPDQIRCAQRWATASLIAPKPELQGDGVILFEYRAGSWTMVVEGSALECTPHGIPKEIGDQVGCRDD
ncbi:hypothetical protein I0C86_25605 [Plantactinospora sp. S1510]|uniref:Lipoprotein n=1 Tax=Plantactinospora alkalitolerans TaxID=2789879 RepID=A0ABS0H2D2_9ACTN|nr:hypothetical protein [Plantactinospora alkalitolerans]MBF9132297.1 hypothetical protein [Plantactinospora alkalitolerans]